MEEATSAVDRETDALVQQRTRDELKDCTLLVIAHNPSTVADFDTIVVLEDGKVLEVGPPQELWETRGGFGDMVEQRRERKALETNFLG